MAVDELVGGSGDVKREMVEEMKHCRSCRLWKVASIVVAVMWVMKPRDRLTGCDAVYISYSIIVPHRS